MNVKIELYLVTPENTPNGRADSLQLMSSVAVAEMDGFKEKEEYFGKDFFFHYPERLESHWDDESQYLMFVVNSRHSLSKF
ncbi:hypothetical protein [Halomonas aquatica]|uniref:Uncharacterized protein n=1 Tax=Halomonas aquatica TaxID=3151123 RepID=A0ABV1NGJ5_9GAMM